VRTHKPDVDNPEIILDSRDDSVFISFDVEYDPVIRQKTRVPINILDFRGTFPPGMFSVEIPCLQRLLRIRVLFPKLTQRFPRDYTHKKLYHAPVLGASKKGRLTDQE
jgi:hypothetical protein